MNIAYLFQIIAVIIFCVLLFSILALCVAVTRLGDEADKLRARVWKLEQETKNG